MKKICIGLLLFLFFQSNILAAPYWVKPGAEIQYYVNATVPPGEKSWGGTVYYHWNNCIANVGFQRAKISFRIVNVSGDLALVRVNLTLYGSRFLKWPYSDVYAYYSSSCRPPFSNPMNVTPYKTKNISLKWADYGNEVSLSGYYKIRLSSGMVYSLNGKAFGHTVLFGLYPSNGSYVLLNGRKLTFTTRVLNSTTYITYYRNFTGPNVLLMSEPVNLTDPSGSNAFLRTLVVYNPSSDVSAGFMGIIPDLEASLGIYTIAALDNMGKKYKPETENGELAKTVAPGMILYNLEYPKHESTSTSSQIPVKHPTSKMWVLAVLGIIILLGVMLWRR
ncbi:hypothetical protein [Thermococcus sp.]